MRVSRGVVAVVFAVSSVVGAFAAPAAEPKKESAPVAPIKPVVDTRFGDKVTDNYRWMESGGPEFERYLAQQNAYTRGVLDALPLHAAFARRVAAFTQANANVRLVTRVGGRYWFLQTPAGGVDAVLARRDAAGGAVRVVAKPQTFARGKTHASIDFYAPSNDGSHVVLVVAHGGGEDWSLRVADADGKLLPDEILDIAEPLIS